LRGFFENLLAELGFSSQESRRITLAIHEACANVIKHGYGGDTQQRIDLTISIVPEDITVEVRDYGPQMGPETIKPRALDDVRPGGLGTHFMQSVMDAVVYCPAAEQGMLVRMTKRRGVPCTSP
jgi:anti-sigma regulatory factor (Ser/Thr protein kinase)